MLRIEMQAASLTATYVPCMTCHRRLTPPPSRLPCSLHPDTAALLRRLTCLEQLVLDGNQADDAALQHVAALPRLRQLSLRHCTLLSDAGLRHLAARRGSALAPRGGGEGEADAPSGSSSGSGGGRDPGLAALDISGCTGLTDVCWLAITEVRSLHAPEMEEWWCLWAC